MCYQRSKLLSAVILKQISILFVNPLPLPLFPLPLFPHPVFPLPLFPLPLFPAPILLAQSLEEPPGEDCTRFDMVIPTVVKPPSTPLNSTPPPLGNLAAEEEEEEEMELGILKQFTFSSELQVEYPPW